MFLYRKQCIFFNSVFVVDQLFTLSSKWSCTILLFRSYHPQFPGGLESSAYGARTWTAHDFRPGRKNYRGATGATVTGSEGERDSTFGKVYVNASVSF